MSMLQDEYFCVDVGGVLTKLTVSIEAPVRDADGFSTRVRIGERNIGTHPIKGVTAMQSLELAIIFAKNVLNGLIHNGNRIYLMEPGASKPCDEDLWQF